MVVSCFQCRMIIVTLDDWVFAFQYHPTHSKALILLADINMNQLKDVDAAEQNYRTILEHEPHNVQARHNLCVVHVERGHLPLAEQCLRDVNKMAPKEEYILRNLHLVQARMRNSASKEQVGSMLNLAT